MKKILEETSIVAKDPNAVAEETALLYETLGKVLVAELLRRGSTIVEAELNKSITYDDMIFMRGRGGEPVQQVYKLPEEQIMINLRFTLEDAEYALQDTHRKGYIEGYAEGYEAGIIDGIEE